MKLKRKLTARLFVIGLVAVLLTIIISSLVFGFAYKNQIETDLKNYTNLAVAMYDNENKADVLQRIESDGHRVTIIEKNGSVIYESKDIDIKEIENHKDRLEVKEAFATGEGGSARESDTLNKFVFYYAKLLPNGDVLRISQEIDTFHSVFGKIIMTILAIIIVVLLICLLISAELTKGIVTPIEQMLEQKNKAPYKELEPIEIKLKEQKIKIKSQFLEIEKETSKINTIIANMEEGFILLDTQKKILMQNDSAIHLLYTYNQDILGKNFIHLTRNEKVNECINSCCKGKSKTVDFEAKNRQLQLLANPVYSGETQIGVICIIVDKSESKQIDKMKQEFTANVSHELKTPLTSISGYAEMIESGLAREEDIKTFAHKIYKEAGRLVALIGDIIQLSQLEEETPATTTMVNVDLKEVAEECEDSLIMYAKKHNVKLETDLTSNVVQGDRNMLYELIYNLSDNAIRYNKENGTVKITVGKKNEKTFVSVKDTGIGIPIEHQSRIFERFYRVDKSRSKQTGGTGLGLAIVKHIAEQHNAYIDIKSETGKGTEIVVTFN